jgi:hypothetical protein
MTLALLSLLAVQPLDEQSLVRVLESYAADGVSWILLDAGSGRLAGERWPKAEQPAPAGSLVKPFTALAYGAAHAYRYPVHQCSTGCWLERGHGRVGLVEALAQSCNSYFERIAGETTRDDVQAAALRYGIEPPLSSASLIGRGDGWRVAPLRLARAYCELARRAGEPGVDEVLAGLAAAAARGTARAVGAGVLAKTGTAPCTHSPRAPGDGFTIVLFPARHPRFALLVRVHGAPGADSAREAARMLKLAGVPR